MIGNLNVARCARIIGVARRERARRLISAHLKSDGISENNDAVFFERDAVARADGSSGAASIKEPVSSMSHS